MTVVAMSRQNANWEKLRLMAYAQARKSLSHDDAEDVAMGVIMRMLCAWSPSSDIDYERYLKRSVHNAVISEWRKAQHRASKMEYLEEVLQDHDRDIEWVENSEALRCAVASMPPAMYDLFVMFRSCGYSVSDTARTLGLPRGVVMRHIKKLRKWLAEALFPNESQK